jgi:hypothetical protein
MKEQNRKEQPRTRKKTRSKSSLILVCCVLVALSISFFLFFRYDSHEILHIFSNRTITSSSIKPVVSPLDAELDPRHSGPLPKATGALPVPNNLPASSIGEDSKRQVDIQNKNNASAKIQGDISKEETPIAASVSQQEPKREPYQKLADELNIFYTHLDQQPYMRNFQLKESSKNHFSKLLQTLLDNPPAITKETDDYFTLLKNTAHFYRVLGKDNIVILKGILDREKDSFENILKIFFTLTEHPEYLKKEFSLTVPKDNLYDYAGFFLNTIGGRLYLFRRDSASRMTVSYYAILVIDRANRQGNSRLGIDLRPFIDSLIEEIEDGGNRLKLKDEYLDTLYDLKESYGNGG